MTRGSGPRDLGVVLVGAGSSTRFGGDDKVFYRLDGKPVVQYSLELFQRIEHVHEVVLVLAAESVDRGRRLVRSLAHSNVQVCAGGSTRGESVRMGLAALDPSAKLVAVHDIARPLVTTGLVHSILDRARTCGAAVPVLPVTDTIHEINAADQIVRSLNRDVLRAVQTPQIAQRDWLVGAIEAVPDSTDEATLLRMAGYAVTAVPGQADNIKITWPIDVRIAELLLDNRRCPR